MPADRSTPSATLADVARRAGVSLATASRALNGSATRQVGEALRARVQQAAADLDYSPGGLRRLDGGGADALELLARHRDRIRPAERASSGMRFVSRAV